MLNSCNGYFQGEHRIPNDKEKFYEESVRVPLLIRGYGSPAGVIANLDLAQTIVQLAGTNPHFMEMDGRALLPFALNPTLALRHDLLIERLTYETVRNESFAFAKYKTGEQELYDLRRASTNYDPFKL